jgi:hypothetical protein
MSDATPYRTFENYDRISQNSWLTEIVYPQAQCLDLPQPRLTGRKYSSGPSGNAELV